MEKAIKQRLLGGLVLVAGAALFLPILLDGSGAPLTVPPMPVPPQVPDVEVIAPKLDQQVQAADQSVTAAHEGQTFAPEPPVALTEEVVPDAAAIAASPVAPAKPEATTTEKLAEDSQRLAAEKVAQAKAAQEKAAQVKAMQERLAREKAEKVKAEQQRLVAQVAHKQLAAKATSPVAPAKAAVLPEAWVVQVASLGSHDKANALVQQLRKKNYRAVSHQQGSAWKVVIGPELRKEVAESIKARLAADPELKLNGWVQAYKP